MFVYGLADAVCCSLSHSNDVVLSCLFAGLSASVSASLQCEWVKKHPHTGVLVANVYPHFKDCKFWSDIYTHILRSNLRQTTKFHSIIRLKKKFTTRQAGFFFLIYTNTQITQKVTNDLEETFQGV